MNETHTNASLSMVPEDILASAWIGHLPFAFWLVEEAHPGILVELGTHNGTSFLAFCQAIKERGTRTKAFAVDTWEGDEHAGHYGDEVHDRLDRLVKAKYAGFAQLMRMLFDDAMPYFSDGSVDLLHIDGLHTYEAVKHDFETWLPKMSRRGVVIFHDTMVRERGFGVWQLWEELRERYPSFELKHSHGLGVLVVGDQPPPTVAALCALTGTPGEAITSNLFDALGQRFSLLDRIAQLEARRADAVQHAANYQAMYESADANLRHAIDSFGTQLEGRRKEVEAASAQILALNASLDALGAEGRTARATSDEAQVQLAQSLAASESKLQSALRRLDEAQGLHDASRQQMDAGQAAARIAFVGEVSATRGVHADDVSKLRSQLRQRDVLALDLRSRLALRESEVLRLVGSHSWRITAPVRWLRGQFAALRRGGPAPTYAEVLEVPGGGARPLPVPGEAVPSTAAAPAGYLQELFADTLARRSPDYVGPAHAPAEPPASVRAKAIAFYLPQFHCFPENEAWWGPGFTEWTNVTKAVPQFVGHEQPQLPADLGFYDLRVPEVLRRQVELARRYGIHGFCFHYYWFGGKRLMEQPLDNFLAQEDLAFPFCLCWANENWTRRWDGRDEEVLISQQNGPDNDLAFIRDLERYLRDPRYIRIDGKPLLVVYRASLLPDAAATLVRWRTHCREVGIGEIFVAMVQFDAEDPSSFGFDAAMEFPPHKLAKGFDLINDSLEVVNPDYQGSVVHYQSIVDSAKAWPDKGFPLIRSVFPGWDNEARRPGKGYTFAFSTPARYRDWLEFAVSHAEQHPVAGESIVMINAWNEWAEGAKLEPDTRYGHAYLQATRQVLDAAQDPTSGTR